MEENTDLSNVPEKEDGTEFNLETDLTNCKNCGEEIELSFEFCPHCGQKAKDDLTLSVLFYNTISNYFSFDARFFKSFIPLMFRPGYVARQFVGGKRLQFLHPAQYYLFVSVVFFFLFSIITRQSTIAVDKAFEKGFKSEFFTDSIPQIQIDSTAKAKIAEQLESNKTLLDLSEKDAQALDSVLSPSNRQTNMTFDYDAKKVDSLIAANAPESEQLKAMGMRDDAGFLQRRFYSQMLKFQKNRGGGILKALYDSIPIALFFLLPIFAVLLKIFYWRRGRFAHHLVFSFYFFSFLFVVLSLIFGVNFFWDIPFWIELIIVLSTYFYLLLALRHFYQQGFFLSLIKSGVISFLYLSIVLPIAVIVMILASLYFY